MSKKVISIETGIWWTKVALTECYKKSPQVYDAFSFRTPEHAIEDGYIRDKESFAEALKSELSKRQITEKNIIFSINSTKVITREISIPSVKDKQIPGIVETQAKEYFPMDISNYTISFRKMDEVASETGKSLKLLLVAVPDNLLSNYCSFAENAGFTIETFEYIGNSAVSFTNAHFSENGVIVQLEEQTTIISMVSGKKLVFQRIAPYGYGTTLAAVLDHPVIGAKDEYEAFDFLVSHDVLHDKPKAEEFKASGIEDMERRQEVLEDAYADIKDALSYHIRVVYTALDYYKNQTKGEFQGKLHLIGEGVRLAGIKEMFTEEIPLQLENTDYASFIHWSKKGTQGERGETSAVGFLSVIGAAIQPIAVKPKELREKETKKNTLKTAYTVLAASILISLVMILTGLVRQFFAVSEQAELEARIAQLSYIQEIYNENEAAKQRASQYQGFDEVTMTKNERLAELIAELENELPNTMTVQNFSIVDSSITLNVSSRDKITAAQLLLNLQEIPFLGSISIPSMAESEDEAGNAVWQFSVLANYVEPPAVPETEQETEAADNGAQSGN